MSTTARIAHPATLGGRARTYWLAGHAARLAINVTFLGVLAWVVSRPTLDGFPTGYLVLALGLIILGQWAVGRFRWLAWAEVPGAWRTYTSAAEADNAAPDLRADLCLAVIHSAVTIAGGLYVAHLPGQAPSAMVGLLGGGMLIALADRIGGDLATRAFEFTRAAVLNTLVVAAPAIAWAIVGDPHWTRQGMLITLVLLLMWRLLRFAVRGAR